MGMEEKRYESLQKELWNHASADLVPPKMKALFAAVIDLLKDGYEMTDLTVAVIADRAGIGKGTTYEYFRSKEELLAGALNYTVYMYFSKIWERVSAEKNFEGMIYALLDSAMDPENMPMEVFGKLFALTQSGREMPRQLKEKMKGQKELFQAVRLFYGGLFRQAVKEGKASGDLPEFYVGCAFRELMSSYVFYCIGHGCGKMEESGAKDSSSELNSSSEQMGTGPMPNQDQIKKRLYENLVYALR